MSYYNEVNRALQKYYPGVTLERSTRKDKKFMIKNPDGKHVHFGDVRYEDYHMHHDEERRANFRRRNIRWADAAKYTPAHLAYYVLW